jgi:hypothetical protein
MAVKEDKRRDQDESDDFLWTAIEIAKFIRRTERFVYHQQKNLQLRRIGGTLVGSKKALTALIAGEAA